MVAKTSLNSSAGRGDGRWSELLLQPPVTSLPPPILGRSRTDRSRRFEHHQIIEEMAWYCAKGCQPITPPLDIISFCFSSGGRPTLGHEDFTAISTKDGGHSVVQSKPAEFPTAAAAEAAVSGNGLHGGWPADGRRRRQWRQVGKMASRRLRPYRKRCQESAHSAAMQAPCLWNSAHWYCEVLSSSI